MRPKRVMLIAGEASGDALAAELVKSLRQIIPESQFTLTDDTQPLTTPLPPEFFGAGGPKMAEAGVELAVDMTAHSVIGLVEVVKKYSWFKNVFEQLKRLAIEREPDIIICVDFSGFNRRFAHAIRNYVRHERGTFGNWQPKIVQYVSPQVWASRPGRAEKMAKDIDLLLCIFPFEKDWYAQRVPDLRVEFVGHPIFDRYDTPGQNGSSQIDWVKLREERLRDKKSATPTIVLLPGSRTGELKRHLPVMIDAAKRIAAKQPANFEMVLPNELLSQQARTMGVEEIPNLKIQIGKLAEALVPATLAIASTGTVTIECAYFGIPTIAMYKTSWSEYQIGKRIIRVKFLAMPNLLANEAIFPELIQNDATGENIAREALDLLRNPARRDQIKGKLAHIIASLGGPGAGQNAARAIVHLFGGVWNPDLRVALHQS